MYHPYVYEMQTRQKMGDLTAEGLRNQELKRLLQDTEPQSAQRRPAEAENIILPRSGIAVALRRWMKRLSWNSPSGINIGS
jgi:hypothetical protein